MSNYTQITFFAPKDALLSSNPAKLIKGADVDPELAAIATAIASKYDATNFAFANPSGTIGLAAVNGSATTPMRSDAAPALSQAIAPTWTGNHTFRTASGAGTEGVKIDNSAGDARFGLYSAGTEYGILQATTNQLNLAAVGASTVIHLAVNSGNAVTVGSAGNVTFSAPSSGATVTVNNIAGQNAVTFGDGTRVGFLATGIGGVGIGSSSADPVNLITAGSIRIATNAVGNVTIAAASSGSTLLSTGPAGGYGVNVQGSGTASQSFGELISAGTNSSDNSFRIQNAAGSVGYFQVRGDGVVFGNDGTSLFELGYKDAPLNSPGTNYTLTAADRGKTIAITNGTTITVPNGVFGAGAVVSFFIGSGSTATIAQGASFTLNWGGNGATTGNRTITGAGIATVLFYSGSGGIISGAGLS